MELTPIDFIAQLINAQKSSEEGYSMPTRWGTLRDDLKSEYKSEAERIFKEWKTDEEEAKKRRDAATADWSI